MDSYHGLTNAGVLGGELGWPFEEARASHHAHTDRLLRRALAVAGPLGSAELAKLAVGALSRHVRRCTIGMESTEAMLWG